VPFVSFFFQQLGICNSLNDASSKFLWVGDTSSYTNLPVPVLHVTSICLEWFKQKLKVLNSPGARAMPIKG
jgi:hypothetical protein